LSQKARMSSSPAAARRLSRLPSRSSGNTSQAYAETSQTVRISTRCTTK
jgi:hypothetical protein